jgi:hypothetical protein
MTKPSRPTTTAAETPSRLRNSPSICFNIPCHLSYKKILLISGNKKVSPDFIRFCSGIR